MDASNHANIDSNIALTLLSIVAFDYQSAWLEYNRYLVDSLSWIEERKQHDLRKVLRVSLSD